MKVIQKAGLLILACAVLISAIGALSIYSSTYGKEDTVWEGLYLKQVFWIFLGLVFFFLAANFNYRRFWDGVYVLYGVGILLLFLVFILGITRLGAQRWLKFAWFNFQPSEFMKLVMIIFLARYFSRKSFSDISLIVAKFGIWKAFILPAIYVAMPVLLIIEQPDLGSALMVIFIFISMIYLSGVRLRYIILLVGLGLCSLPLFWHFLRDYQKERLMVFLNPDMDPLGAGYTIIQSKIAIGSGGIFGKGWLSGTQGQLHFLPESHTDFIFASFAEEWGFLGVVALFSLYYILVSCGINIALRTTDYFGKLLALGIVSMLVVQIFINIAMTIGLAPVVGIPLPLMSYGGSAMITNFIALGILANIDKRRGVF